MSTHIIGLIGIVCMMVLMFSGMWVGMSMALVGLVGYSIIGGVDNALALLGILPYTTVASHSFSAIPLFVFMGSLVAVTAIGKDLFDTAYKWFARLPGGLAISTLAACGGFAAICGSDIASILTMGKVALPEMKRRGYNDSLATACVVSGGTVGLLIPPSMAFILYGILTEVSIGKLFLAGILPGILLISLFMVAVGVWVWRSPKAGPAGESSSWKEKILSLRGVWMMAVLFLLVLGGIYVGWFTPTEAGAVGTMGALVIAAVSRRLSFKQLRECMLDTGLTTCMVLFIIIGAFLFMNFLSISQFPQWLASTVAGLGVSRYWVLLAVIVMYIVCGMFLEIFSAVMFTVPILFPLMVELGFDPIWFGVIVVILIELGLITPPVGLGVYCLSAVSDVPTGKVFRGVLPFVLAMLICVGILTIFPEIALVIPQSAAY